MNDPTERKLMRCPKCNGSGDVIVGVDYCGDLDEDYCPMCSGHGSCNEPWEVFAIRLQRMCRYLATHKDDNGSAMMLVRLNEAAKATEEKS